MYIYTNCHHFSYSCIYTHIPIFPDNNNYRSVAIISLATASIPKQVYLSFQQLVRLSSSACAQSRRVSRAFLQC